MNALHDYQLAAADRAVQFLTAGKRDGRHRLAVTSPTGSGKCLAVGTRVLDAAGRVVPVEDVQVGDQLLGPDSLPRQVLSTTRGRGLLYRVNPVKGDPYVVNGDHILALYRTPDGRGNTHGSVEISVRDYMELSATQKHRLKGYRSPAIEFPDSGDLPVPAYVFGLWLGDGTRANGGLTSADPEVVREWEAYAQSLGMRVTVAPKPENAASTYLISHHTRPLTRTESRHRLLPYIRRTGLDRAKFIPHEYKTASAVNRRELLAGLLDTDGYYGGCYDIVSKWPALANDIAFVARSLGLAAYVRRCEKTCCNNGKVGTYWRVSISGALDIVPCRVPRKRAAARLQKKSVLRVGITVEPIGDGEYAGFMLGGDGLFLLEDFTVTHNSFVQIEVKRRLPETLVVVPSHEIACGMWEKLTGEPDPGRETLEAAGYWTTMRLYNELQKGTVPLPPYMIYDEGHRSVDDTHESLWALAGFPPRVDFTATLYRGTPKETKRLRDSYLEVYEMLSLKDAVRRGVIALPHFITWPLLDDHTIDVVNGEFVVKQVDNAVKSKLVDLVARVAGFYVDGRYDRPTMVAFSSVEQCRMAEREFTRVGLPCVVVVADTRDRQAAFARVVAREAALIQVAVVGEGVDLPIRRLIDVAPTMSPRKCMQRWGRATRPTDVPPEIISCCHNFTRHSYLWHGLVPRSQVAANQQAWGDKFKLTRRDMARALGLEGFGKFVPNRVPLADGTFGTVYALQTEDGMRQFLVYLGPTDPEPRFFTRGFEFTGETAVHPKGFTYNVKQGSKWQEIDSIPDLDGCLSIKADAVTPKMLAWWRGERGMKGAARVGLDPNHVPNAREFQILPVCCNAGVVLS